MAGSVNTRKYFFFSFFHCRLVTMAPADGFVVVDTKQFYYVQLLKDAGSLTQSLGCVGYKKLFLAPDHIEQG